MPANKINYLAWFSGDSQIYGSTSKRVALELPPPDGRTLRDKRVVFVTFEPDNKQIVVHPVPQEEILNAVVTEKKVKKDE